MSLEESADGILTSLLPAATSILLLGDGRAIQGGMHAVECSKARAVSGQIQASVNDIVTTYVSQ